MAEKDTAKEKTEKLPAERQKEWAPMMAFRKEMDRLFEDFFGRGLRSPFAFEPFAAYPEIDVVEDDKRIAITADVPGMSEKDIQIFLSGNTLTLKGEKKEEKEEKEENYIRMERRYGSFNRSVTLPEDILSEKAEADFKNGVLKIEIPKSEETASKRKRIPIKSKQ